MDEEDERGAGALADMLGCVCVWRVCACERDSVTVCVCVCVSVVLVGRAVK